MTTLVSDIIRDAYREGNLIAIGTDISAAQQTEGLRLLQRILSSVYGNEAGEALQDFPIGDNNIQRPSGFPWYGQLPDGQWIVPPNTRLVLNLTQAQTVYINPMPADGERFSVQDASGNLSTYPFTVDGNGRKIGTATAVTFSTNGTNAEYIYRSDLGRWLLISPVTVHDDWPFPSEYDDMFVIMLAMRLNPRYNISMDPQSAAALSNVSGKFKAKYRQHRQVGSELALQLAGPWGRYFDAGPYGDAAMFNTGYPFGYWRRGW